MTNFNERTNRLLYNNMYLLHFLLKRVDVSVVCERWVERHILRERTYSSHIFFKEPGGANVGTLLQARQRRLWSAACASLDCDSLHLCLTLTAWFSSRDLFPVTHLFDLSAMIVLSCLLIKMWQLEKYTGSLGTNRKSMVYVIQHKECELLLHCHYSQVHSDSICSGLIYWSNRTVQSFKRDYYY